MKYKELHLLLKKQSLTYFAIQIYQFGKWTKLQTEDFGKSLALLYTRESRVADSLNDIHTLQHSQSIRILLYHVQNIHCIY